jgi:hypothetical protein
LGRFHRRISLVLTRIVRRTMRFSTRPYEKSVFVRIRENPGNRLPIGIPYASISI